MKNYTVAESAKGDIFIIDNKEGTATNLKDLIHDVRSLSKKNQDLLDVVDYSKSTEHILRTHNQKAEREISTLIEQQARSIEEISRLSNLNHEKNKTIDGLATQVMSHQSASHRQRSIISKLLGIIARKSTETSLHIAALKISEEGLKAEHNG